MSATSDEEVFLAFHQLASQRKMDLAMRGLDVPNLSIDEMFEEAQRTDVPQTAWDVFLRRQLPSPAPIEDSAASAAADDPHHLRRVGELIAGCCHGDEDIDVHLFVEMGVAFVKVLETLGTFAALSLQEATGNLKKISTGAREVGARQ